MNIHQQLVMNDAFELLDEIRPTVYGKLSKAMFTKYDRVIVQLRETLEQEGIHAIES